MKIWFVDVSKRLLAANIEARLRTYAWVLNIHAEDNYLKGIEHCWQSLFYTLDFLWWARRWLGLKGGTKMLTQHKNLNDWGRTVLGKYNELASIADWASMTNLGEVRDDCRKAQASLLIELESERCKTGEDAR